MTETVVASPSPVSTSPSTKKTTQAKKKAVVKKPSATHPSTSIMVTSAITELKEKKGSSLPAIKKYLAANYKVEPAKMAPFIRKFLKAAVANGTIVQTVGHFKIAAAAAAEIKPNKKVVAPSKKSVTKKPKTATPKKKIAVAKKPKTVPVEPAAKKLKKATVVAKPKTVKPKKKSAAKTKVEKSISKKK